MVEKAFKRFDFERQQRAFVGIALAVDEHIAACLGQILGLVVFDAVGPHHHAKAAQCGGRGVPPLHHGLQLGAARHRVATQKRGQRVADGGRYLLGQAAAVFEGGQHHIFHRLCMAKAGQPDQAQRQR